MTRTWTAPRLTCVTPTHAIPATPRRAFLLAQLHLQRGQLEQALAALAKARAAFPKDRVLLRLEGDFLLSLGRFQAAKAPLEALLELDPEHVGAH